MDIGVLWLLAAGAVGFVAGWLVRAQKTDDPPSEENSVLAYKLRQRDEELAAARAENTVHLSTLDSLRNEIAAMRKELETRRQSGPRSSEKKRVQTNGAKKRTGSKQRRAHAK